MIDKARYQKEILEPALRDGAPPADLFTRYAVDPARQLTDGELTQHAAEVVGLWKSIGVQKRRFAALTRSLVVAHLDLAERRGLTWQNFHRVRQERVEAAWRRVDAKIATLVGERPCVSTATVKNLASGHGGLVSEMDVARRLEVAGVRIVVQPWRLPAVPAAANALRSGLRTLDLQLSAELVFSPEEVRAGFRLRGGFRLKDGRRLDGEAVAARQKAGESKAYDARKNAVDGVLAVLAKAARAGTLDDLLLWEVRDRLAKPGLTFGLIVGEAISLGFDPVEAEDLTLAVLEGDAPLAADPQEVAAVEAAAALEDGDLREAARLRDLLGDDNADLRARIESRLAEFRALTTRATRAQATGRTEEAAELLAEAIGLAPADEALVRRLAAVPPPSAADVRAGIDGGRVVVSWRPSTARTGRISYRVVRTVGAPAAAAAAGQVVVETSGNDAADPVPPAGVELHYTVFARRDEGSWSAPASGPAVRFLPEIANIRTSVEQHAVRVSWDAPPDVAEVEVTRAGRTRPLRSTRDGFVDNDVQPGTVYRYRIRAVYRSPGGARMVTPGVEVGAAPQAAPRAVTALDIVAEDADSARLTWNDPATGRVVIHTASAPPRWREGDRLTTDEVGGHGREVSGVPVPAGDGQRTLVVPLSRERRYFTAITVGGGRAVAGPTVSLRTAAPVRELEARRFSSEVRLSWLWPDGALSARVAWLPGGGDPAPITELSRRAYRDNGGCVLHVGTAAGRVEVRSVFTDAEGTVCSPPVGCRIVATGVRVAYEFRRRRMRPGRAVLRLTTETETLVPALDVVHGTGPAQPLRREQGRPVHRTEPCRITPDRPYETEFEVPKSARSWLVCFGPDDGSVILTRLRGSW